MQASRSRRIQAASVGQRGGGGGLASQLAAAHQHRLGALADILHVGDVEEAEGDIQGRILVAVVPLCRMGARQDARGRQGVGWGGGGGAKPAVSRGAGGVLGCKTRSRPGVCKEPKDRRISSGLRSLETLAACSARFASDGGIVSAGAGGSSRRRRKQRLCWWAAQDRSGDPVGSSPIPTTRTQCLGTPATLLGLSGCQTTCWWMACCTFDSIKSASGAARLTNSTPRPSRSSPAARSFAAGRAMLSARRRAVIYLIRALEARERNSSSKLRCRASLCCVPCCVPLFRAAAFRLGCQHRRSPRSRHIFPQRAGRVFNL